MEQKVTSQLPGKTLLAPQIIATLLSRILDTGDSKVVRLLPGNLPNNGFQCYSTLCSGISRLYRLVKNVYISNGHTTDHRSTSGATLLKLKRATPVIWKFTTLIYTFL